MCINKIKIKTINENNEEIIKEVPCGHCLECMQQKSTDICVRGMIEYKKWKNTTTGCFLTLTYSDKYLPENRTLLKKDYIIFIRELRRYIKKTEDRIGIRILGCGEYGTKKGRPHYHLVIFNWCPNDLKVDHSADCKSNNTLYKSKIISEIWGKGKCVIGTATEQTIGYVAGYTSKKGFKKTQSTWKKPVYEKKKLKEKTMIYNLKNITKLIKWTSKNGKEYFKKIRIKEPKIYKKEFEFIATPRGKMGGLGSVSEEEMIKMIKDTTINLNCGKQVKTFSIPYYYRKKLKEILKERQEFDERILKITKLGNNWEENAELIIKAKNENKRRLIILDEVLSLEELRIEKLKKSLYIQEEYEAKKHKMTINQWKEYKTKIKINKIIERAKNLERDYEKIKQEDEVHSYKPWFLENEIGEEILNLSNS